MAFELITTSHLGERVGRIIIRGNPLDVECVGVVQVTKVLDLHVQMLGAVGHNWIGDRLNHGLVVEMESDDGWLVVVGL